MLIIKIPACEKSMEKPGQMGQQKNHCVCVCVREREKREERGERRERGKRVSGNEIYGAYDGTGCDGATKSELFSNFYMYYWFKSDYKSFLIALLPLDHFYFNFIFKVNFTDF